MVNNRERSMRKNHNITLCSLLLVCILPIRGTWAFVPIDSRRSRSTASITTTTTTTTTEQTWFVPVVPSPSQPFRHVPTRRKMSEIVYIVYEDDDDDEEPYDDEDDDEPEQEDPYRTIAASEFMDDPSKASKKKNKKDDSSSLVALSPFLAPPPMDDDGSPRTNIDWGGALGKLRQRMEDSETGRSQDPSHALFRLMSAQTPSQQITTFVQSASPQVVQAMTGAVGSLLGGLAQPTSGVDVVVKASGEKMAALCFQLQMTGYMFRNAEYVMALKDLMKLRGTATLQDYKDAFEELDSDDSGYIDTSEIEELLDSVYDGKTPSYEVQAFLKFFDANQDGKITWDEFERGLGTAMAQANEQDPFHRRRLNAAKNNIDDDDDDDYSTGIEPDVVGTIEIELEDGKVVEVEAKEYIENLKKEARALKAALRREMGAGAGGVMDEDRFGDVLQGGGRRQGQGQRPMNGDLGGIAEYIAKRQGDIDALTKGISPEIVNTMKMLVDFVLDGGDSGKARKKDRVDDAKQKAQMEMELPASALQQLALWQLILGYRLREAEAKGDYLKLLE